MHVHKLPQEDPVGNLSVDLVHMVVAELTVSVSADREELETVLVPDESFHLGAYFSLLVVLVV